MQCPDADVLSRLVDGALRPDEAGPVREHVRGCKKCQDTLRHLADEKEAEDDGRAAAPPQLVDPRRQIAQAQPAPQGVAPNPQIAETQPLSLPPEPELAKRLLGRAKVLAEPELIEGPTLPPEGPGKRPDLGAAADVTLPPRAAKRHVLPNEGDTREFSGPKEKAKEEEPVADSTKAIPKGQQLGRYVILQQLGVGGMGVVYSALDPELNRKVALKLLRTAHKRKGAASGSEGRARLLREAQAMARISHPNIVGVYDVGSIGDEVYLAMELVEGQTLTEWLKKPRTWREVVDMFRYAGRGLAAAHTTGLVHRDFKPDNVLVANDGRVRVTDFGLARPAVGTGDPTLSPALLEKDDAPDYLLSPLTRAGTIVGTPVYMAPEQFVGEAVDARTDQYSFCVALYEALYGQLPYKAKSVRGLAKQAMAGKLPKLPLDHRVPLSVHRILLRGLRPAREDRWPSMNALLAALEIASWFRRRLAWAVVAAGIILGVLAWKLPWGRPAQDPCSHPERQLAGVWDDGVKRQVKAAFDRFGEAQAGAAFPAIEHDLDHYVEGWTSARTQACEATYVRKEQGQDVLDLRLTCLDRRRRELAAFVQLLQSADAQTVTRTAQTASTLPDLSGCADIAALLRRSRLPAKESDRARVEELRGQLAQAEAYRASGQYPEAVKLCTSVASAARDLRFRPLEAEAFLLLGRLLDRSGDYAASEQALLEATWAAEAAQLLDLEAEAMIDLVTVVGQRQSRHAEGRRWGRHAAAVLEALSDPPRLAAALVDNLGTLSRAEGNYEQSLADHQRALALREKTLGPDHVDLSTSLEALGATYSALGRKEEALACSERALKLLETAYGRDHPRVTAATNALGGALSALGRYDEGLAAFRRALAADERVFGPQSSTLGPTLNSMAQTLAKLGRLDEAQAAQERALAVMQKTLGEDHPRLGTFHLTYADILLRKGDFTGGLEHATRALAIREKALGPNHFDLGQALYYVADAYLRMGRPRDALPVLERALKLREGSKAFPSMLASIRFALARALWATGGDKERARQLGAMAEVTFSAEGPDLQPELNEAHAWLERNGGATVHLDPP